MQTWTAEHYTKAKLPWFEYNDDDATAVEGSSELNGLKTVATVGKDKGEVTEIGP